MSSRPPKIFIAEDDRELRDFLSEILSSHGYEICVADSFAEAKFQIENEPFSLALLDILFPDGNGIDLLKKIRKTRGNVPVIMQTALGDDAYCVLCLKAGADDSVAKPVRQGSLLARVEAVLRRAGRESEFHREFTLHGGARVFPARREILFPDGKIISLTVKENRLLQFLFSRAGTISSTEELLLNVWNLSPLQADSMRIPALVSCLRKKLGGVAEIRNLRGGNYLLETN